MTKPSILLARHLREIGAMLHDAGMSNPRLFGSVARLDDSSQSDIDIIVDVAPEATLFDLAETEMAIEKLLGCRVEILAAGFLAPDVAERAQRDVIPLSEFALS